MGYSNALLFVMPAPVSGLLSTDQNITIDMAIQQLQALTPHWWCLGEAAGVQRTTLKEVSLFLFGVPLSCICVSIAGLYIVKVSCRLLMYLHEYCSIFLSINGVLKLLGGGNRVWYDLRFFQDFIHTCR